MLQAEKKMPRDIQSILDSFQSLTRIQNLEPWTYSRNGAQINKIMPRGQQQFITHERWPNLLTLISFLPCISCDLTLADPKLNKKFTAGPKPNPLFPFHGRPGCNRKEIVSRDLSDRRLNLKNSGTCQPPVN